MPIQISPAEGSSPTCAITIDGIVWPIATRLVSLESTRTLDGLARLVLRLAIDPTQDELSAPLRGAPIGATVGVGMGYRDDVRSVFDGAVRLHRLHVPASALPQLELEAASHGPPLALQDDVSLSVTYGATLLEFDAERTRTEDDSDVASGTPPPTRLSGRVLVSGTTLPRVGALMSLRGMGVAFGGDVRIVAVRQRLELGHWATRIAFQAE